MLILRGEQGVPMSFNQVCVCRRAPTFSSDVDGRVFLCQLPRMQKRGGGSWNDPRARATRGLRRMGRVAWLSSCSRNAHDKNVLVRRAQSRISQATPENEMGNWEDARS